MSSDDKKPTVTPMPNGPYVVKDLPALANQKGPIEMAKSTIALCRCGKSATKPFCDGAHAASGFSSDKDADRRDDAVDRYEGEGVVIEDNRGVCAHAARCTDGLPAVFKYGQEPWIDATGATREEVGDPAVFVAPNGPYVVTGADLADADLGEGATAKKLTLCRCGLSKNKPFCDGSHWDGFVGDEN